MEEIFYKNKLIGIRVKHMPNGTVPITNEREPLQALSLRYKKNTHIVEAHFHAQKNRSANQLQECLVVIKGKIKIDLYGQDKKYFKSVNIKKGELFIRLSGGYKVSFLEDSEIFEFKNGPYKDDKVLI